MTLTELAPSGLRCIDRPELEILQGLAWVWGDTGSGETTLFEAMPLPGLGRLSFIGNSSGLEQPQQAHTRVIVRHWPFWASTPGLRDHPGRIMVPASPVLPRVHTSAAATWGPTLGSRISCPYGLSPCQRRSPSMRPVLAAGVVHAGTRSPGLPRAESTGFRTAFTGDPLARFRLASSTGVAPAALPWALALEWSAVTPRGRTPARVWAFGFGRTPARRTARLQYPDRARPRCLDRHGRDLLRGQL